MKKYHDVDQIRFEGNEILLRIDGEERRYPLEKVSPKLLNASDSERQDFEISPSGYGIHWPSIDEDLSIDGLLGIVHHRKGKTIAA